MGREAKIRARQERKAAVEAGLYGDGTARYDHTTINATHISESGFRYAFPKSKEGLYGKTVRVKGYRSSRDQLVIQCDGCKRKHSEKSGLSFFGA